MGAFKEHRALILTVDLDNFLTYLSFSFLYKKGRSLPHQMITEVKRKST